jgi:hypothetical protein
MRSSCTPACKGRRTHLILHSSYRGREHGVALNHEHNFRILKGALQRLRIGYNHGYTRIVKTAISIPDSIFEEAERLAKDRGWSRSELYANAVTAYVSSERFLGVREKLDAVYGRSADDSAIDPLLVIAQARSLPKEKW